MSFLLRRSALAAGLLAAVLALLLLLAGPARAQSPSHAFLFSLTGTSPPPKNLEPPPWQNWSPDGDFEGACAAAVDSAGDIYIADYYHDAVDVYSGAGYFLTQIKPESDGNGPCGLAVDPAGDVYVDNWHQNVVELEPSSFPPGLNTTYGPATVIDSGGSTGLALDPAGGNLYVDDGTYLTEYTPSDAPVLREGNPIRIGLDPHASYYGLAVSAFPATAGDVYVADAAEGTVKVYEPAGDPVHPKAVVDGAGTPQAGFNSLIDSSLAVDPTDGHLFVADDLQAPFQHPEAVIDEFNPAGDFRGQLPHAFADAEPSGLAVDGPGDVFATSGNGEEAELLAFGPTVPAHRLEVSKTGTGAGTVTSAPAGIACANACAAEYNVGESLTLTAQPAPHSRLLAWSGCESQPGPAECRLTLSADRSAEAEFAAIPQQTLEVTITGSGSGEVTSAPAGIACNAATCSQHFDREGPESFVTLTAQPAPHSRLLAWSGCESQPGPAKCQVNLSADRSVEAEFATVPQQTLNLSTAGSGTVTSAPAGIDCRATCAAEFDLGAEVTLTATPDPHQAFSGWSGAGCSGTGTCTLTMSQARSLSAAFAPILHTLAVSTAGSGTGTIISRPAGIDCAAGCSVAFEEGTPITLTALPDPGAAFTGWSGGGCSGNRTCKLTLGTDTAVQASFASYPGEEAAPPLSLTLGRATPGVGRTGATLQATVSAPGSLSATGRRLKRAVLDVPAPGATTLRLALSRAGERALAKARRHLLKIRVTVTFTPGDGTAPLSATKIVAFRAKRGGH